MSYFFKRVFKGNSRFLEMLAMKLVKTDCDAKLLCDSFLCKYLGYSVGFCDEWIYFS